MRIFFKIIKLSIKSFFSFLELFKFSYLVELIFLILFFIATFPLAIQYQSKKIKILFGVDPIINHIYWANSLKNKVNRADAVVHFDSDSFIAKAENYDSNIENFFFKFPKTFNKRLLVLYSIINSIFIYYRYNFFWISFNGGPLNRSILGRYEIIWMKICKKKIIVHPFGSDSYEYSMLNDKSLQHVLLTSQGHHLNDQKKIKRNKSLFFKYLDSYPATFQDNFIPRWDFVRPSFLTTDLTKFNGKKSYDKEIITIVHAPNHKGFKGTRFIEDAINSLKNKGYKINFILVQGMEHEDLINLLKDKADILIDQLIFNGYAMSAIEGMAAGIPVISNLENSDTVTFFKRFSFLKECPIYSANPESIEDKLEELIKSEALREEIGEKGKLYVKKFHSYEAVSSDILLLIDGILKDKNYLNHHYK